jgi:lipopolysaccharide heptosyltransferase I
MPPAARAEDLLPQRARVLVVRLSALGDVLFALETVAALKTLRPDLRIDFLVEDRFAALLRAHPQLEAVRTLPRRGRLAYLRALRALRAERYDLALDLHGLLKSAIPMFACRAARKLGFAAPGSREGAARVYDRAVELPRPLPHRADRGLHLLRALGLDAGPSPVALPAPPEPPTFWDGVPRPRVVLHPGASAFAAFKRWPAARFADLAARLAADGIEVAVSFGPGEADLAAPILAAAPRARPLDGAALGLVGLAAVYRGADLVVAADTGPLHLAAAAGVRVVALFGPKDPRLYGPRGRGDHAVLFHDVPCRPCRRRRCASPQCILGLQVETVEAAVRAALAAAEAG